MNHVLEPGWAARYLALLPFLPAAGSATGRARAHAELCGLVAELLGALAAVQVRDDDAFVRPDLFAVLHAAFIVKGGVS